ncbi:hypothetical protein PV458_25605 [Streptomyces sp. MN03-5084-2B]|nr:hypothetical protein [Streptomyces sp. MN03-5084-2B]
MHVEPVVLEVLAQRPQVRHESESTEGPRARRADAAVIALGHAAGGEAAAEWLSVAEAEAALQVSLLRLVGAERLPASSPREPATRPLFARLRPAAAH